MVVQKGPWKVGNWVGHSEIMLVEMKAHQKVVSLVVLKVVLVEMKVDLSVVLAGCLVGMMENHLASSWDEEQAGQWETPLVGTLESQKVDLWGELMETMLAGNWADLMADQLEQKVAVLKVENLVVRSADMTAVWLVKKRVVGLELMSEPRMAA